MLEAVQVAHRQQPGQVEIQVEDDKGVNHSLTKGAQDFGVDPKTLRAALERDGIEVKRGATYTTVEIHMALSGGDLEKEKILETRARRIEIEKRNQVNAAELLDAGEVARLYASCLLPLRQALMALPAEACAKANPSDPQLAREALQQWVDGRLPLIRDQLPK